MTFPYDGEVVAKYARNLRIGLQDRIMTVRAQTDINDLVELDETEAGFVKVNVDTLEKNGDVLDSWFDNDSAGFTRPDVTNGRAAFLMLDDENDKKLSKTTKIGNQREWAKHELDKLHLLMSYFKRIQKKWPINSRSARVAMLKNRYRGEQQVPMSSVDTQQLVTHVAPDTEESDEDVDFELPEFNEVDDDMQDSDLDMPDLESDVEVIESDNEVEVVTPVPRRKLMRVVDLDTPTDAALFDANSAYKKNNPSKSSALEEHVLGAFESTEPVDADVHRARVRAKSKCKSKATPPCSKKKKNPNRSRQHQTNQPASWRTSCRSKRSKTYGFRCSTIQVCPMRAK